MHNVFSNKLFSILTVLVFTSSLLFLVAAPFSISSTPTQPRQAHAQESLTTAIGSGLGKGISACLGNLVTQFLIPQTVGKVAGLSFVSPSGLPTTDVGAQIAQGQNAFTQFVREGCLDAIAYFTAQSALDKLSQDTLAWVNSGFTKFGQSGNSAFVGDLEGFYSGVSDQSYNRFIQDITEIEGPNNPLSGVCESFQPQIVRSVSESYFNRNESPSPVEPIQFGSSSEIEATNCEELAESVGTGTVEAFISGEFEQGGWEAFRYTVENPSANPVGAYLEKNKQLKSRVEQATNLNQEKLQRGNGYVSAIACPNGSLDPQTQRCEGPSGEMTEPAVKTPGSVVDEQLNEVIGSGQRQLELADEVNEIVGALTDQLIGKITGTGSSGGPGGVFSQAAQEASYSGNVEEYAEGGYTGGFQANYASSTLADQIELEQDFRAAVEQLPSTDAIDRTRVRAQQCLRNNKLGGPGEVQDTEKLLAQLNAIEDAVFPPAAGSRETEDTQELLEKAEENPDQSVGTSTDGGSGVAKTNWAGEELDWERGTIYGLESCEEGETKYPLTGLGTGNINFSYSNSDNAWLGFVCALNEFDDPTTGSDSIHVDLQPFVQFFDRASDFNRDNPNNESSGSTTVTAEDTENIPKNYESYMNKSGYKEDIAANKVKIDWTGARFDWKFYDLFADKDQLQRVNDGLEYYEDGSYRYQLGFRGNGGTANRYGAQTCREQTQGSISWIIKPGTDQWIQQKCIEDKNGDWQGWAFFNTGETRPAYDTIGTQVTTFQGLIDKIDTLIGDTNYDNLYTAPVSEEDNLRELKHDLTTIDENLGQNESINDRQQKLDRRFGRMQDRFHSEDDIEFASEALQELDGDIDGSVRSQLQTIVENNNCELPDDYVPPTEQRDPDDSGGGGGGGGGSSQPLSIDSFSATREGSSLMTVQWSATALTCYAVDNPDLRAWSGQELPLDGNRSYPVETNQSERLTLRCENTDGESVRQSSFIEPSLEDGFEQSL